MVDSSIDIGDKVYVSGLFGDDFIGINNKIGRVHKIFFSSTNLFTTYIAHIKIDDDIVAVNLAYIFKLSDLTDDDYYITKSLINPLETIYTKFNIVGTPTLAYDDVGRSLLFCQTRENSMQPMFLTGFN